MAHEGASYDETSRLLLLLPLIVMELSMPEIRAYAGSETRRDISTDVVTGGWMVVEDRREQVFEEREVGPRAIEPTCAKSGGGPNGI